MAESTTQSQALLQTLRRWQELLDDAQYPGLAQAVATHVGHMPPGHAQALLGVIAQVSTALERVAADTVPARRTQRIVDGKPLLHRPWCPLCVEQH
jgi:hypothetical protein